jgi:hypothetical protein
MTTPQLLPKGLLEIVPTISDRCHFLFNENSVAINGNLVRPARRPHDEMTA